MKKRVAQCHPKLIAGTLRPGVLRKKRYLNNKGVKCLSTLVRVWYNNLIATWILAYVLSQEAIERDKKKRPD
jgi:hypothetical protein